MPDVDSMNLEYQFDLLREFERIAALAIISGQPIDLIVWLTDRVKLGPAPLTTGFWIELLESWERLKTRISKRLLKSAYDGVVLATVCIQKIEVAFIKSEQVWHFEAWIDLLKELLKTSVKDAFLTDQSERIGFYAMLGLTRALFSTQVDEDSHSELARQLEVLEKAAECVSAPSNLRKSLQPARADKNTILVLLMIVRPRNWSDRISVQISIHETIQLLEPEETKRDLILSLLRFHGSNTPWFGKILEDLTGETFISIDEYEDDSALAAPEGCDFFVAVGGPKASGKTSFLMASEHVPNCKLELTSLSSLNSAEGARSAWNNDLQFSHHSDHEMLGTTPMIDMTRYLLFDPPALSTEAWGAHFRRFKPVALVLIVDATIPIDQTYYRTLMQRYIDCATVTEFNPIYIVFNKLDAMLKIREINGANPEALEDLRTLAAEKSYWEWNGTNCGTLFSIGRQRPTSFHEVQELLRRHPILAAHPELLRLYETSCGRIQQFINYLLKQKVEINIGFSIAKHNEKNSYCSVDNIWRDLVRRVSLRTKKSRKDYFRRQFKAPFSKARDREHELRAKLLIESNSGEISPDCVASDFEALLYPRESGAIRNENLQQWFQAAANSLSDGPKELSKEVREGIFDSTSPYHRFQAAFDTVEKRQSFLRSAIGLLLEELGFPKGGDRPLKISGYFNAVAYDRPKLARILETEHVKNALDAFQENLKSAFKALLPDRSDGPTAIVREAITAAIAITLYSREDLTFDWKKGIEGTGCRYLDTAVPSDQYAALLGAGAAWHPVELVMSLSEDNRSDLIDLLSFYDPVMPSISFRQPNTFDRFGLETFKILNGNRLSTVTENNFGHLRILLTDSINAAVDYYRRLAAVLKFRTPMETRYFVNMLHASGFCTNSLPAGAAKFAGEIDRALAMIERYESLPSLFSKDAEPNARKAVEKVLLNRVPTDLGISEDRSKLKITLTAGRELALYLDKLLSEGDKQTPSVEGDSPDTGDDSDETSRQPHEVILEPPSLSEYSRYHLLVEKYLQIRSLLTLRERAVWLQTSKWMENDSFVRDAATLARVFVDKPSSDKYVKEFEMGVENMLNDQTVWGSTHLNAKLLPGS
jgi:hypothetical protein